MSDGGDQQSLDASLRDSERYLGRTFASLIDEIYGCRTMVVQRGRWFLVKGYKDLGLSNWPSPVNVNVSTLCEPEKLDGLYLEVNLTDAGMKVCGYMVESVEKDGAAEVAGVKPGMIILRVGTKDVDAFNAEEVLRAHLSPAETSPCVVTFINWHDLFLVEDLHKEVNAFEKKYNPVPDQHKCIDSLGPKDTREFLARVSTDIKLLKKEEAELRSRSSSLVGVASRPTLRSARR